jgi:hypothetical protein
MIALRREKDGTLTFQIADTVLRGVPESEFTEGDVRTLSGEIHHIVQAMCMQTRIGLRRMENFYVPLDGNGAPNELGVAATCEIIGEITMQNAGSALPDAMWVAIATAHQRGMQMDMQFAPFFASRLFTVSMVLKWMNGPGYLAKYWRACSDPAQFVRDICYFAHVQFDQFMRDRIPDEQAAAMFDIWTDVSVHYDNARTRLVPVDVYMLMQDLLKVRTAVPKDDDDDDEPAVQPKTEPIISAVIDNGFDNEQDLGEGDDDDGIEDELLALMYARSRVGTTLLRRRTDPGCVELFMQFRRAINMAIALAATMCVEEYSTRERRAHIIRKMGNVLISIPYIVHNDCAELLLLHTRRFRRLEYFFPQIVPTSIAGLCFYAQFLTEAQMDMYIADLMAHVEARANRSTCDVILQYIDPDLLAAPHDDQVCDLNEISGEDDDDEFLDELSVEDDDDDDDGGGKRQRFE